jgi:hypothetical protein
MRFDVRPDGFLDLLLHGFLGRVRQGQHQVLQAVSEVIVLVDNLPSSALLLASRVISNWTAKS